MMGDRRVMSGFGKLRAAKETWGALIIAGAVALTSLCVIIMFVLGCLAGHEIIQKLSPRFWVSCGMILDAAFVIVGCSIVLALMLSACFLVKGRKRSAAISLGLSVGACVISIGVAIFLSIPFFIVALEIDTSRQLLSSPCQHAEDSHEN